MNAVRILAIAAMVLGVLGAVYGGFSYTKEDTVAKLGPVEVTASHQEHVNVPLWAGIAAIIIGGGVLALSAKK